MQINKSIVIAVMLVFGLSGQSFAQAEAEPGAAPTETAPATPAAEPAPAEAAPQQAASPAPEKAVEATPPEPEAERPEEEKDPMAGIGIGLKLGYLNYGKGSFEATVSGTKIKTNIASRDGLTVSIPINLGGSGFGWLFEPYLGATSQIKSIGLITGPTIVFHLVDPLYLGVGIDLRVGWLLSSGIDMGADLYGRIPITATYYVIPDLGIVAELGIGYGATGIKYKDMPAIDPTTGFPILDSNGQPKKLPFGLGTSYQIDFSLGVRWP